MSDHALPAASKRWHFGSACGAGMLCPRRQWTMAQQVQIKLCFDGSEKTVRPEEFNTIAQHVTLMRHAAFVKTLQSDSGGDKLQTWM